MPGESPLNMMRPQARRQRTNPAKAAPGHRRGLRTILALVAAAIVLAGAWCLLWYYAAGVTDRTLAAWVDREAKAGRIYACGAQTIRGFPFRIEATCRTASAKISGSLPPFAVTVTAINVIAAVYHPTRLVGEVIGPLAVAEPNHPTGFVANWSRARMVVSGLPPAPDSLDVALDRARLDRTDGANATLLAQADSAQFEGRIVGGNAVNNPVIDATLHFRGASAPAAHPLLAEPLQGDIDAVFRGFKDLLPKPWSARFREMQEAGGNIEIKSLRIARSDALIVGTGTLTVNEHGKLDGLVSIAIVGIERIVPLLGVDKMIAQGIDRLSGMSSQSPQGTNALDRLLPGLSGVVRDTANAGLIENLKKMGQPTEIDNKPAILLPLRIADGSVYLGMLPLGELPPLF
ncbi:MAG TPA: DUF2125 domain-containing protein [Xanthobacteraceae bacterium]|nr:DUF2125 domain-containing protein [Xanthobacteraceae bacterium]